MTDPAPRYCCDCGQGFESLRHLYEHAVDTHYRHPTLTELQPGRSSHDPPRSNG